jgi:hypothetical protein
MSFAPIGYDVASRIVRFTSASISSVIIVSMRAMVSATRRGLQVEVVSRVDRAPVGRARYGPRTVPEHPAS